MRLSLVNLDLFPPTIALDDGLDLMMQNPRFVTNPVRLAIRDSPPLYIELHTF